MKEEAGGRGAAPSIRDGKEPSEDTLCHLKCFGVRDKEKDEGAVKCILRFKIDINRHSTWR